MPQHRGLLIVLEGIDGSGTSTQTRLLCDAFAARGRSTHATHEPSTGPVGLLLREMLAGAHAPVDQTTLSLLYAADRADHVQREVEPALAAGKLVVSDRWYHSSLAYQGAGGTRDWVAALNRYARAPDLTIFLEVAAEIAARRRADDGRSEEIFDRLEIQQRVAADYREVIDSLRGRERIEVLDGERPLAAVSADIVRLVEDALARAGEDA
ncbi:dTMP kinase [Haliangium ochraceum]|uniref:Thymidylate kinase n=1 Tax=Haliangium ochraceum (strain DSM 14365 / JCM 11303 / SMP-2) TaxID=502025 RepID=D0LII3_HALO1|nr:dTMP kinase [Haliangium ochraceum]ACY18339.1 thymidylate kinase [Haliangium ochraceum DSM 14365]